MNQDDDQRWLDALAGREGEPSASTREARALRAALRADAPARVLEATRSPVREDALIARAVREGVLDAPKRAFRPRTHWHLPLAASVVLVFAAGLYVKLQPTASPVVRGDEDGIVRLQAKDAASLKRAILLDLREAGVSATGYETLGVHGIDADLPMPLSAEVQRVLARHHIAEPPDGVLRLEIRSTE